MAFVHQRLEPLTTPKQPFASKTKVLGAVTWVRPELVCEVKFSNWTQDGGCARRCSWGCARM